MKEYELPPEATAELERVRQLELRAEKALASYRDRAANLRRQVETEEAERRARYEDFVKNLSNGSELIAGAWADYEDAITRAQVDTLREKGRPARKAAKELQEKGKKLAQTRRELKVAEWALRLYETNFPWLTELRDPEVEQAYILGASKVEVDEDDKADPVSQWISADEFARLSVTERNQKALDRYLTSRKSPWELGRDYERYVGYLRESDGYMVTYQGIFAGLEDLGRDLLAERDGVIEVIQCKRWAQHKTIHEKHIFQLFGTVVAARIENPGRTVTGTFTTTTTLSEKAHQFADQLGIRVEEEVPLADYPRIKCNISRRGGERIYHLPFDQQYDRTSIEPKRGELWASTVTEAEAEGFRRAWRWSPTAV